MSTKTYMIRSLRWHRHEPGDSREQYVLRASGAGISFEICTVAYRRYLHMPHHGDPPTLPTFFADFDERNHVGPTECATIAACKMAADACYRRALEADLIEVAPNADGST